MKNALVIWATSWLWLEITKKLKERNYDIATIWRDLANSDYACEIRDIYQILNIQEKIKERFSSLDLIVCIVWWVRIWINSKSWITNKEFKSCLFENVLYVRSMFWSLEKLLNKSNNPSIITIWSKWTYSRSYPQELWTYAFWKRVLSLLVQDIAKSNKWLKINNYCVPAMDSKFFKETVYWFEKHTWNKLLTNTFMNSSMVAWLIVNHSLLWNDTWKILRFDQDYNTVEVMDWDINPYNDSFKKVMVHLLYCEK